MTTAEENLNTEPNDIAGNRIDGPVGNTATQHTRPGEGVGQPGGPPTSPTADAADPAAPVSSEALAAAETSMAEGAVDADAQPQENKEADPADLVPEGSYGGNFGNSTQNSYHDQNRRENQDSDPNRGEFGAQDLGGTTHGGPGRAGEQDNAYRRYDGRDERPDSRTEYGFEAEAGATAPVAAAPADTNDNGSSKGPDSGYAADYGHTSIRTAESSRPSQPQPEDAASETGRRNQTEDYLPAQGRPDSRSRPAADPYSTNQPEMANHRRQVPADQGRDQPNSVPDNNTGDQRNGYTQPAANKGDAAQGIGSRGGSYNDAYDDSKPGSTTGSPAKGDQRAEDTVQNYGAAARQENRAGDDNNEDHGAPQRNAGRDGEADE